VADFPPDTNCSSAGFGSGAVPTPNKRATESQEDLNREGVSDFVSGAASTGAATSVLATDGAVVSTVDCVGSLGFADGLR
jgi:hypothetical protein